MALLIGANASLDEIVAALQTWAGKVDGINAAGIASGVPAGAIFLWGSTTAPSGYLICDGSAVARSTYSAIFAVIGTTYGTGDGSSTFNLPDLRQRFPLGKAASGTGNALAATGGAIDHVHTGPSHTHTITTSGTHTHGPGTLNTGGPDANVGVDADVEGASATVATVAHEHDVNGGVTAP